MTPEQSHGREPEERPVNEPSDNAPEPVETAAQSQTEAAPSSAPKDEVPAQPKLVEPVVAPGAPGFGDDLAEDQMRPISRRSFLWAGLAVLGTGASWRWLNTRRTEDGLVWPLRRSLDASDEVALDLFGPNRLAPEFSRARIQSIRTNGDIGLGDDFDAAKWHLSVQGLAGDDASRQFSLAQIKALPRFEMITELKCIEGWSRVNRWVGARLSDFMKRYPPATQSGDPADFKHGLDDLPRYIGLKTPDGAYYVGLEREAALHPQTLLCYEMNSKPLAPENGAPLRLAIPVKYGIKNLKRIGTLSYTSQRPADYWAEQGYDYYAGH